MDDVAYCYEQAEEAQERALRSQTESLKQYYEELATRWISLARSYDLVASLNTFTSSEFDGMPKH